MKSTFIILIILIVIFGCNHERKQFDFTIKGTVIGQDTGKIFFRESPRVGDEVFIPIQNGTFIYKGKSLDIFATSFQFYEAYLNGGGQYFPFIIEPGVIEIELNKDSLFTKSRILQGEINKKYQKENKIKLRYLNTIWNRENTEKETDSFKEIYKDSLYQLAEKNADNFCGILFLKKFSGWDLLDIEQQAHLFDKITKPELRCTPAFKTAYSKYRLKKENINQKGEKAYNFVLPDSSGKMINFYNVSKNKTVYVERSGSWCGNQTNESKQLIPVYEDYKDKGFEIVTIVKEAKYNRWKNWLKSQKFPWVNVIEMEYGNTNDVYYADLLFAESSDNYLVDENGIVVATGISASKLNEILMQKYAPEKYVKYLEKKWELPKGTYLLDREKPINTFEELTSKFSGKAFFIDCYATWCSPCIDGFQYKDELFDFLKKHKIELVYISFDRKMDDSKWLNFIKKYNLTGFHMRANEDFKNDFTQKAEYNGQLPTYMLIDKNGIIVENNAIRPSNKNELFNQLKTKLNQ